MIDPISNDRLSRRDIEHLERVLGADRVIEIQIVEFIRARWGGKSLFDLPRKMAVAALYRPAVFIRAAKQHYEPELPF